NVVVHASDGYGNLVNGQLRLQNTVGAWQALLGVYMQLNSIYQNNMKDMLLGNVSEGGTNGTQQAWNLLLQSGLYTGATYQFIQTTGSSTSYTWTAWAE